jgi:meso-butanediol dehydrogenase / (S,S)-butanediol dehydrogenase / diacetyl reductase
MSVAVVTGAGRGLGRGIALALAADGTDLVLGCRLDVTAAEDTASACRAHGVRVEVFEGDVREAGTAQSLADTALHGLGALDVWVNNAGVSLIAPLLETDAAAFTSMLDVNVIGVLHGMQAAAVPMVAAGSGRIINLASDAGLQGFSLLGAYAASKFAVVALTQTLALELAGSGVTVNAVCPGTAETAMNEAEWETQSALTNQPIARVQAEYLADIPLGRFCTPADVGATVAFLASGSASFITGQSWCVNGGTVLH